MKSAIISTSLVCASLLACASTKPTQQLIDARQAHQQASQGSAPKLVPDALYQSQAALEEAEDAHEAEPGSFREEALAYIAHRKALEASALAQRAEYDRVVEQSAEREKSIVEQQRNVAEMSLKDTEQELAQVRTELQDKGQEYSESLRAREAELAKRQQQLEQEREARREAEKRAEAALKSLEKLAKVQQEEKRLVITLSGAVLFEFGKATLLPSAKRRLDEVATALKAQDANKPIVIEGHTDSVGTDTNNKQLSQERANAVRQYIVSKGVAAARVEAVGRGETDPIADNSTPEGRANNRRVEIIIENNNTPQNQGVAESQARRDS